jgi:hypothetical protein
MGTDSGCGSRLASWREQAGAIGARFAQADDAAAADLHARIAHALEGVEPVLVVASRDDRAVVLGCGVEVVVVVVEAGVAQLLGLAILEHPERAAGLQAQRLHRAHHVDDGGHVARLRAAPRRAHAEARGTVGLGGRGRRLHLFSDSIASFSTPVWYRAAWGSSRSPRGNRRS